MEKPIILTILFFLSSLCFSNDLFFFRNYQPTEPFIHFFNKDLKSVDLVNDGKFGLIKERYDLKSDGKDINVINENGENFNIKLDSNIEGKFYDNYGLWQTFKLNYSGNLLNSFIWEHRFMVEGREEPLMIKEENIFEYENGFLKKHINEAKYSSRIFNYTDGKLSEIVNTIGNGEKEWTIRDKVKYTSETDYIMEPCTELNFYSLHYPRIQKKIHTELTEDGITTIKDTYYYINEVYYETIQQWDSEKILSLTTYTSIHDNTTTFTYNYE